MATAEQVLATLAEPRRRQLLDLLVEQPRPVAELVELTGLSQPGASKHLRVLREAGLVRSVVHGRQRIYQVRAAPLRVLDQWLEPYRRLWSCSLDRLQAALEEDEQEGGSP